MKRINYLLIVVALYACDRTRTLTTEELELKNNLWTVKGEEEPYTGMVSDSILLEEDAEFAAYAVRPEIENGVVVKDTIREYMIYRHDESQEQYLKKKEIPRTKMMRNGTQKEWEYDYVDYYVLSGWSFENYLNDTLHGNAQSYSLLWDRGCEFYLKNDKNYTKGKLDGKYMEYHIHCPFEDKKEDFVKVERTYKSGEPEGRWRYYWEVDGEITLREEKHFLDGKLHGTLRLWKKSQIKGKLTYLAIEETYQNGFLHDKALEFYDSKRDRQVKYETDYVVGAKHGYQTHYSYYGVELSKKKYLNDIRQQ